MSKYYFVPNTIDLDASSDKGFLIEGELNTRYFNLRTIYYKALQLHLNNLINIDEFEQAIGNSELNFIALDDKESNIYHKDSDSDFIFIRNNLHIEKLTPEEITFLENQTDNTQLLEFVKTTLERVLYEEHNLTNFGPAIPEYFCSGKTIVIELAHDQKACKTANELYQKKDFINELKRKLIEIGQSKGIPISVVINEGLFTLENTETRLKEDTNKDLKQDMDIKSISEEDFATIFPRNNNVSLKEMDKDVKEGYLTTYSLYRKLLLDYLMKRIALKKYDQELASSELKFIRLKSDDMDIYQYFTASALKYLYIRNNIYLENLTNEERQILYQKIKTGDDKLDKVSEALIASTFKRVIFENVNRDNSECLTNYGPESESFLAPNNALVIGIRYDEFNSNGLDDDSWGKLHDEQLEYIFTLADKMEKEISGILGIPVAVLKYNEYSVKKKVANQTNNLVV